MNSKNDYALVTGASLGIGREIVRELSKRNINTLLVALDGPELHEVKQEISDNYKTQVDALGIDLTDPNAAQMVFDWCNDKNYNISILINNAGFGDNGKFEDIPLERYFKMMDLNNKAYIAMIHKFLPKLKEQGYGHIMNTSSMEAYIPLPYKAVYSGTKNFVYAYSLSLNEEVRHHGVKVSILCPGPVLTNEGGLKRIQSQGGKANLIVMMPDQVAKIAVKNMLKGMMVINPGKMNWWVIKLVKFIPTRIKMAILEKMFRVYK